MSHGLCHCDSIVCPCTWGMRPEICIAPADTFEDSPLFHLGRNSARGHVFFTNSSWWPLLPPLGILTVAENFVSCEEQCGHTELPRGWEQVLLRSTLLCKQIASKSGVNSSVRESFLKLERCNSEVSTGDGIQQVDG